MNLKDTIFRVCDCESTGLDPATCGVCEAAYADIDYLGDKKRAESFLLNPGMPIPPGASAVHHIVDADVKDAPHLDEIRHWLIAPVYVAHNAKFDESFLKLPGIWLCTHRISKHLYPDVRNHSNQELRYHLKLEADLRKDASSHRAGADVAVTVALFTRILQDMAVSHPDITTVEQLVEFMNKPALLKWIPFKAHRDTEFANADSGLLQWILNKGAGGEDCVYTAKHYLDKKFQDRPYGD